MLHKLGKITIGRWRDGGKFGETGSPAGYRGCIGFGNEESLPYKGSHFENGRESRVNGGDFGQFWPKSSSRALLEPGFG